MSAETTTKCNEWVLSMSGC